ncbi:MAG: aminoacyl-tRNA hydrolase [Alphaproteobacteria bacterium]
MLLLVGLGNPGAEYAHSRHNAGFRVIERLVREWKLGPDRARFQGITNDGSIGGEKIVALRPQTHMNESGRSVGAAVRFFKLEPNDVIVFHDEADLEFGKLRWKTGGGSAGNNGIKSVTAHITDAYHRLRIGVGRSESAAMRSHVLGDFSKAEGAEIDKLIEAIVKNADLLAARDYERYMSKLALTTNPPRNAGPKKSREPDDEDDT